MTCGMNIHKLTARENQAIMLRAEGFLTKECAERMGISVDTASEHIKSAYAKLETHTLIGALRKLGLFKD